MPFFTCELAGGVQRLSFSTADDPFYKLSTQKYYPEAIVFNKEGEIKSVVNYKNKKSDEYCMIYHDDIRDPVLKINDDKKITISLGGIREVGSMILLLVREFDVKG